MLIFKVGEDNVTFTSLTVFTLEVDPSALIFWEVSACWSKTKITKNLIYFKAHFPQKVENILLKAKIKSKANIDLLLECDWLND